jgi:hypothetical protein
MVGDVLLRHCSGHVATSHTYTYREINQMLEKAGFAHVESYASLNKDPFKLGADMLLMEAIKTS